MLPFLLQTAEGSHNETSAFFLEGMDEVFSRFTLLMRDSGAFHQVLKFLLEPLNKFCIRIFLFLICDSVLGCIRHNDVT